MSVYVVLLLVLPFSQDLSVRYGQNSIVFTELLQTASLNRSNVAAE